MLKWIPLESIEQVSAITERSHQVPCVIFKHSIRCNISYLAMNRLEQQWDLPEAAVEAYYLDLIKYRDVSSYVAEVFGVHHESPQLLLIQQGECPYETSHLDITVEDLKEALTAV